MGKYLTNPPHRKLMLIGAKLALAALLMTWLVHSGAIDPSALFSHHASAAALVISACCVLLAMALGVYRWRQVMAVLGVPIRYPRALQIYWIGAFASTFLPGAATGDLLRVLYVVRDTPQARARSAVSVVLDRVFGLLGFMLTGLVLIAIRFDALLNSAQLRQLASNFLLLAVAVLLALGAALWIGKRLFKFGFTQRVLGRLRSTQRAALAGIAHLDPPNLALVLTVLGISLTIPLLLTCALMPFVSGLPFVDLAISSNAAQVANTVPLTPGGIGIGEGVFDYVLSLLGRPSPAIGYATAFLSLRLVTAAVNAVGGVLFFIPGITAHPRAPCPLSSERES